MADDPRLTAKDFSRDVLSLFDKYVHGAIDRRGFLEQAAVYAGSAVAATGMLAALSPDFARAQKVALDDARIVTSRVDIPSPNGSGSIRAYLAMPKSASVDAKKGVVLVVHENRGLNPHIEDIARRLAVDGFIAVAPDALTGLGGYPGTEEEARTKFQQLDQAKIREDMLAAADWAEKMPQSNGKLGAVGFCYGGGIVNMLAARKPTLRAGVPFYGGAGDLAEVAKVKAEMLVQHGGNDTRLVEAWPAHEAALKAAGVTYQGFVYANAEHGFNNDTTPRYDEAAAKLAWERTLALYRRTLA